MDESSSRFSSMVYLQFNYGTPQMIVMVNKDHHRCYSVISSMGRSRSRQRRTRKRRHNDSCLPHSAPAKQKPFNSTTAYRDPVLSDDSLTELGVTGYLSDYDDSYTEDIFLPPSPDECPESKSFRGSSCVAPPAQANFRFIELKEDEPTALFDSPEEGRRGWSELGLKLRKPDVKGARAKLDVIEEDGYFSFLADEVILSIFTYMPKRILAKCARVCKRWKRLAYDETLWRRLDLGGRQINDKVLGPVILGRGVEYLRLANADILGDNIFEASYCAPSCRLQFLDLSMASISELSLEELLFHCKQLRKLSLESLTVNNNICRAISHNLMLTTLNCTMVSGLSHSGLRHILRSCTLLHELNLAWIRLPLEDVKPVISQLPRQLLRLNLSGCRENIDDSDVKLLVSTCPLLQELDLSDSLRLTESSVLHIQESLPFLQAIHLSSCLRTLRALTDLSIHSMMQEGDLAAVRKALPSVLINGQYMSTIARPTVGMYRTSLWGERVRDLPI
ncbi:S-phase kinase-associated protein 2-like isoform X2 [Watersipora subatra]|uniref:S-phase kinase-associated protein 2-like isoform X2 n=1 Tax=Watersipora subatra TaxID=2589382 RepID=UPI00355B66FB